jgi:(p)ppGpp synthase/HD superfamily hydrolase
VQIKDKWSASAKAQRKRLVKLLQQLIAQLEQDPVPLEIDIRWKKIYG